MADIGARTYADIEDVEGLIGDIVASRHFDTETVPTAQTVVTELDNVAAKINVALDSAGYTVPVDHYAYPDAWEFLKAANAYGASARLLGTIPTEAYDPDEQMTDMGNTRAQMYERYLNEAIKWIEMYKLRAGMRVNRFDLLRVGSAYDADGNAKSPLYRRRMAENGGRLLPSEVESTEEDE